MLRGPDSPELFSDETLRSFIARFETGLIPGAEWTHASHVAMAGAYLLRMPAADALELVRKGILNLNAQNKVQETILRGYHESITRVWLATCDAFLQESGLKGVEAIRALVAVYGLRSDLHKEYYSYDVVVSEKARNGWQPPDRKALPAAWRRGELLISTNPRMLSLSLIHEFLTGSYWAEGIPKEVVARSIQGSLPFGLYESGVQIGFARVISDLATYAYLADVFVCVSQRGRGLAKWLMECVLGHPSLQGIRRWQLVTRDAHALYEKAGFRVAQRPERMMDLTRDPNRLYGE